MNTQWPGIKEATSTKDGYAVAENGNSIKPLKFGISFISSFINGYQSMRMDGMNCNSSLLILNFFNFMFVIPSPNFKTFKESRNLFIGIDSWAPCLGDRMIYSLIIPRIKHNNIKMDIFLAWKIPYSCANNML